MKKTLIGLAVIGFLLCSSLAMAVPVQINVQPIYVNGRLYDPAGNPLNVLASDPVAPLPQTLTPDVYMGTDNVLDSSGVGLITSIKTPTGFLFETDATQELTFVYSGLDDVLFKPNATNTVAQLFSLGLHLDVFLDTTPDFQEFPPAAGSGAGDGVLALSLDGHLQIEPTTGGLFNLEEDYFFNTNEFIGTALLDVTGGSWASIYDTNTIPAPLSANLLNPWADFSLSLNLNDFPIGTWALSGSADGPGNAVPEPTTMLLFGTGLIGLAGFSRRKLRK